MQYVLKCTVRYLQLRPFTLLRRVISQREFPPRLFTADEIVQHDAAPLDLISGQEQSGPLGKAVAALALGSVGTLSPKHEITELELGVVVGGLDAVAIDAGAPATVRRAVVMSNPTDPYGSTWK